MSLNICKYICQLVYVYIYMPCIISCIKMWSRLQAIIPPRCHDHGLCDMYISIYIYMCGLWHGLSIIICFFTSALDVQPPTDTKLIANFHVATRNDNRFILSNSKKDSFHPGPESVPHSPPLTPLCKKSNKTLQNTKQK